MSVEKERLLLSYLVNDPDLFSKVHPIVHAKYFDPSLKSVVNFIKEYFDKYKGLPSQAQLYAEHSLTLPEVQGTSSEARYAESEIETFCRDKAIEHAIYASVDLLKEQKLGEIERLIREAITISLQRNLGTDFFADPELCLRMLADQSALVPTKMKELDKALDGGLPRKGMIIFAAPSGVGKSLTMSNVARNLSLQGLHGVYFTLELSEEMVLKRFASMYTGIGQTAVLTDITKTAIQIQRAGEEAGSLLIKRLPESSTNANHLRAYLKEYELVNERMPDYVVVDYLDLMASNNSSISVENQFIKDKYVAEELRSIANDLNLIMITASQLNRGAQAIESLDDLNQGHVAGGISKINTTDNFVAILQTPQMKARNEMVFKMLKTRSSAGVGKYFIMKFDPISLRLMNLEGDDEPPDLASSIGRFKRPNNDSSTSPKGEPPPWNDGPPIKRGFGNLGDIDDLFKT
jgi:KaiC/GvpD/RAD55 family RecA-like ATPase